MKASNFLVGIAVCGALALGIAVADTRNANSTSTSISIDDDQGKVTMRGDGIANILGDKVEAKNGTVFINGISFGVLPAHAEISYVVTRTQRTLYVDGKPRGPVSTMAPTGSNAR
jgi:hypothetical protein